MTATVLSVVIPVRDGASVLGGQLASLARQRFDHPWEVVVVDNGSCDDTVAVASSWGSVLPRLVVVDGGTQPSPGRAMNLGASMASGNGLVFLDADDEVAPGYLAAVHRRLGVEPVVAARLDHDSLNPGWERHQRAGSQTSALTGSWFLPFTPTCALSMRRDVLDAVGPFTEDLPVGYDVWWSWTAQLAGYGIAFEPDAVVRYRYRTTIGGLLRQQRSWGRAEAALYRRLRERGVIPARPRDASGRWRSGLLRLARARSRGDVARASVLLGGAVGRLEGSVRERVWFP